MSSVRRLSVRDPQGLERLGFQSTGPESIVLRNLNDNIYACPFLIEDDCCGPRDPENYRCVCNGTNFSYKQCRIFQLSSTCGSNPFNPLKKVDPNADTVIMHADELVKGVSGNGHYDDSIHDQISDGKRDISDFFDFRDEIELRSDDSRVDF